MTVNDVLTKVKFIVNDENLYSLQLGNTSVALYVVQDVVNTILKTLQINKKRGYLRVFPFSKNYYFINKFTSTSINNLPYACQLPTSMLAITDVFIFGKNTLSRMRYMNEPLPDIASETPALWSGGASYLSVSPTPRPRQSDPTSSDIDVSGMDGFVLTVSSSDLSKMSLPQPIIIFVTDGPDVYFHSLVLYYTATSSGSEATLSDPEILYRNPLAPDSSEISNYRYFLPNLAFDYIDSQLFSSLDDVVDMPEDFKDAIAFKICEYVYDRMRMENESVYYRRKYDEELKRLMNYVYGDRSRPAIRERDEMLDLSVRYSHRV